jgi:hypothetical protein
MSFSPNEESTAMEPMPHYYWDCFGWEDIVPAVAKAYEMVPPQQRAHTAIFAHNFPSAGAVDIPKYGLPKVISGHQSCWLWGPRHYSGQTVIVLGETLESASRRRR